MSNYSITTTYMTHSGGSKFYEMVMIIADSGKERILIKRYGSMTQRLGGGQVKIEKFFNAESKMRQEFAKTLKEKERGKSDGYYSVAPGGLNRHGLYALAGSGTEEQVKAHLKSHYSSPAHKQEINNYLFSKIQGMEADGIIVDELNDIVVEEPKPEPDRGGDWASW